MSSALRGEEQLVLPWREAGLTERQAAAHLLSRWTFGPRPGEVDRLVDQGLEAWVEQQLDGTSPEPEVGAYTRRLRSLELPTEEFASIYPAVGAILQEAVEQGVIPEDFERGGDEEGPERRELRRRLIEFARENGYRSQRELVGETMTHKLVRGLYAENQLVEVLTDFWFNHFNVSITDNIARPYVLAYERDAIRPHVLGSFRDMLGATARHPAMLFYLDNAQSTAAESAPTALEARRRGQDGLLDRRMASRGRGRSSRVSRSDRRSTGLNENYARELLELHTLGVDGGYSQEDVIEVARAFSGWTALPPRMVGANASRTDRRISRARRAGVGFVIEGGFIFRPDAHDAGPKVVLGQRLAPGRGLEDGEEVLDLVASHSSTAAHIARKLATRFVCDEPSSVLVGRLAESFERSGGDLSEVLRTLVQAPEFWAEGALQSKVKTPFELAVSALRALDARLYSPRSVLEWIRKMGQPLYAYQAPTGFPDRASHWVNTGSLLHRMNFGLALAAGEVDGVQVHLNELLPGEEPESRVAALEALLPILLPERDASAGFEFLAGLVEAPDVAERVAERAPTEVVEDPLQGEELAELATEIPRWRLDRPAPSGTSSLAQVVGVILGSPEFQNR